jgi:hypothetical protein
MSKAIRIVLIFTVLYLNQGVVSGQSTYRPNPDPVSKLGWGVNLGNMWFYNNTFQFGLAPNVAYNLNETLAAGIMVKLDYYYERFPQYRLKLSALDIGPTVFARWKPLWNMQSLPTFLQGVFLQAEYERAFIAREAVDENGYFILNKKGNRIKTERHGEDYLYLGLGLTSGYPFSTLVSIHYNIMDDFDRSRQPFTYRVGFTYNY